MPRVDKLIPESKLRAALILLTVAMLALSGGSSPVHLEPPVTIDMPDEWSLKNKTVPRFSDLSDSEMELEMQATHHLDANDFCPAFVASKAFFI